MPLSFLLRQRELATKKEEEQKIGITRERELEDGAERVKARKREENKSTKTFIVAKWQQNSM